jgi:broad specificity phosphatase PhoE
LRNTEYTFETELDPVLVRVSSKYLNKDLMSRQRILYLIRHAQSKYNHAEHLAIELKQNPLEVNFRPELLDAHLTDFGISQTHEAAIQAQDLDITTVLVSPLRRALQTAYNIFKDHKNKPKLKVFPMIREKMGATCDIAVELNDIMKEFPMFDYSIPLQSKPPEHYFFDTMRCEHLGPKFKQEFLEKRQLDWFPHKTPPLFFMDRLFKENKDLESRKGMKKRVEEVRKILLENIDPNEKLALVSHASFLKAFTATNYAENGYALDGHILKNCEILKYELKDK